MGITFQIGEWIELSVAGVGLRSHTWNAETGVKVPKRKQNFSNTRWFSNLCDARLVWGGRSGMGVNLSLIHI